MKVNNAFLCCNKLQHVFVTITKMFAKLKTTSFVVLFTFIYVCLYFCRYYIVCVISVHYHC
jgi:hypothetical protein